MAPTLLGWVVFASDLDAREMRSLERLSAIPLRAAVLASDGSPTRAADELYCHRNTVMHRLRRIESVTGRKVTDPRSRLLWQLALLGNERGPLCPHRSEKDPVHPTPRTLGAVPWTGPERPPPPRRVRGGGAEGRRVTWSRR